MSKPVALVIGVGDGLSASLARVLAPQYALVLAARDAAKLSDLTDETGARTVALDATDAKAVTALFAGLQAPPRVVIYNPSYRVRGPIESVAPAEVRRAIDVTAFGAFLAGQAAVRAMLEGTPDDNGVRGTILFTGASAGVKGFAQSASFAMGKFAQRGLAESMAREVHPKGIHVAWVNIDGAILNPGQSETTPHSKLRPDAIAQGYLHLIDQPPSAWSHEMTLRPWVETF